MCWRCMDVCVCVRVQFLNTLHREDLKSLIALFKISFANDKSRKAKFCPQNFPFCFDPKHDPEVFSAWKMT